MANPDSFLADNEALIAYNKDARHLQNLQAKGYSNDSNGYGDIARQASSDQPSVKAQRIASHDINSHLYTYEDDPQ